MSDAPTLDYWIQPDMLEIQIITRAGRHVDSSRLRRGALYYEVATLNDGRLQASQLTVVPTQTGKRTVARLPVVTRPRHLVWSQPRSNATLPSVVKLLMNSLAVPDPQAAQPKSKLNSELSIVPGLTPTSQRHAAAG